MTSTTSGPGSARPMTLTGTVADGVEAGCLVFHTADRTWTLVGKTTGLRAEDTVTVRGVPMPDLVTTCQQGEAFRVDEVVRS